MKTRTVLWFVVFFAMAIEELIFLTITIAIVDMVKFTETDINYVINVNNTSNKCSGIRLNAQELVNQSTFSINYMKVHVPDNKVKFDWSESDQGLIQGAFFWSYWVTAIPGAVLTKKYGTKLVFGLSTLFAGLLCFLVPFAANLDIKAIIFIRFLQGFISGVCWPSMHELIAHWIPPNERSKFVTAYCGTSFGNIVFIPLFGYIMTLTSWEWVFYLTGIFICLWYILWLYILYDTPRQHPRISLTEKSYIEDKLGDTVAYEEKIPVPWIQIFTSRPVWVSVLAQFSALWGILTLIQQSPTYFNIVYGINTEYASMISGFPHILRIGVAFGCSMLCDYLLETNKVSRTNVRKFATNLVCTIHGLFVVGMAFSGCNYISSILFYIMAVLISGNESNGPLANMVDLSPNFASVLLGLISTVSIIPGFLSPYVVGLLTYGKQDDTEQWKYVFLITSTLLLGSGILYTFFGESNIQPWNYSKKKDNNPERETNNSVND